MTAQTGNEQNQNIRIVLEQRGRNWFWELHERGEKHVGDRAQPSAELAAQEAQIRHDHLDLSRHFKKQRADLSAIGT